MGGGVGEQSRQNKKGEEEAGYNREFRYKTIAHDNEFFPQESAGRMTIIYGKYCVSMEFSSGP
jgi:hypothetical protein